MDVLITLDYFATRNSFLKFLLYFKSALSECPYLIASNINRKERNKRNNPNTITHQKIKYLEINLTKEVKEMCNSLIK